MRSLTVDMDRVEAALDLRARLKGIPDSAGVRGIFFNQLRHALRRELAVDDRTVDRLIGAARSSHRIYPARDFVEAQAIAGALVEHEPQEGIRRLSRGMASFFSSTWYGRVFQRFLVPEPYAALQWVAFSRDYICNYGSVRLERRDPHYATLHFFDEYCWVESCQRGGCEGMLVACGVEGTVTAEVDAPFRGRLHVKWSPAS